MSVWAEVMHQASFAGVEFDCITTSDTLERSLVRRTAPRRNGGRLQDMGAEPRTTRCQLLFFDRKPIEGEDQGFSELDHVERFRRFVDAATSGKVHDFVHPLTGTYRAAVEGLDFDLDAEQLDQIDVSCTFVEDSTQPAVFAPGAGDAFAVGASAVRVLGELLDVEFGEAGLDDTIGADAGSLASMWESGDVSAQEINLQLASMATRIDAAVETYELAADINRYPCWRQTQILLFKLRQAAESFRQEQPQLITVTLAVTQPLRMVLVDTYGAGEADSHVQRAMRLNDIDDPSAIPAGTSLRLASPDPGRHVALRRTT